MVQSKVQNIVDVLTQLLLEKDVLAVMVSTKAGQNFSPSPDKFKVNQIGIWQMIAASISDAFSILWRFKNFGINKIYIELGDYEVFFFMIDDATLLVCIVPALANKGLLEVEHPKEKIEQVKSIIRKEGYQVQ